MFVLVGDELSFVSKDGQIHGADEDVEDNLQDSLECPAADEVLIALRKSFSLTFPENPFIEGLQASLAEIRRIGVEALKPLPEVLTALDLRPIPLPIDDPAMRRAQVCTFTIARSADLFIKVRHEGRRRTLIDIIDHYPADPLISALRAVVSETFSEAHDEDQHEEILKRIRSMIGEVLPPYNPLLKAIEVEPIAGRGENEQVEAVRD